MEPAAMDPSTFTASDINPTTSDSARIFATQGIIAEEERIINQAGEPVVVSMDSDDVPVCLSKMVAVLCEQHLFLPLLRAFEMFLPSCSLLPFMRALQVC